MACWGKDLSSCTAVSAVTALAAVVWQDPVWRGGEEERILGDGNVGAYGVADGVAGGEDLAVCESVLVQSGIHSGGNKLENLCMKQLCCQPLQVLFVLNINIWENTL
jgi:hypothetical protein